MRQLWPPPAPTSPGAELDRDGLTTLYAYPEPCARPVVRVNFVSSVDGAVSVDGISGGLDAPGDRSLFGLLREVADVVLAGSGTVRAEGYRGVRTSPERRARLRTRGQSEVPPVAVVTATCDLDPTAALFTDTAVAPVVLTAASAPAAARTRLTGAGAEVVTASDPDRPEIVDPVAVLTALARRGMSRVLCEGGPALFASLVAAGRVDELCLSLAPTLAGPGAGRIVTGLPAPAPVGLRLASVVAEDDGLLLRYRTARGDHY